MNSLKKEKMNLKMKTKKLTIAFEDKNLLIVDKPAKLLTIGTTKEKERTLYHEVLTYLHKKNQKAFIVNRIDKDTSGLMVVAKNNKCHELLSEAFKNKTINRYYTALVIGELDTESGIIDAPIGRDPNERKRYTVTKQNSKTAITHFNVIKRYKGYTLLNLKLDTGRTHQIRVHMKYIGYPIYNDPIYTNAKCSDFGQFLHSREIDFNHPITNKHLHFTAPLPKEFQDFINNLTSLES